MTLDLVFVQQNAARALDQLTAELGLTARLVARRVAMMEIFAVDVLTVEFDADSSLDEARTWFAAHGIHHLA